MNKDTTVHWTIANPQAIRVDTAGEIWHAGCVRDVIVTGSGETIVASDTGGVWSVTAAGNGVSLADWDKPDLWCLARGPLGQQHLYAGGSGLYETDTSHLFPLANWHEIGLRDTSGNQIGVVYRIASLAKDRTIVLATSSGVFWSPIPERGATQRDYHFQKVRGIPEGGYLGLAVGPNRTVAAAYWGTDQLRADIFVGGLQHGVLILKNAAIPNSWARLVMYATTLASCDPNPRFMYGVSSDADGFVSVFLRSIDGGQTWDVFQPKLDGSFHKFSKTAGNQGNDSQRPCNTIAVAPNDRKKVVIGWRNAGILISTDGDSAEPTWHLAAGDAHVHSDLHTVYFDPTDRTDQNIYVGGDGGLVLAKQTSGTWSFDSSFNRQMLTLQFQSWPQRPGYFYGSFSASPKLPGLIAGGLQDNGNVASLLLPHPAEPWVRFAKVDDGQMTQFVETGHLLYYFNDDSNVQDLAWDVLRRPVGHTWTLLDTNSPNPELIAGLIVAPVRSPRWRNQTGDLMYAVGVRHALDENGADLFQSLVFGFFSDDVGKGGHWQLLADFGVSESGFSAVGSADGTSVFLGSVAGKILQLDNTTKHATEFGIALQTASGGAIYKIVALSNSVAYATYNVNAQGYVLQKGGHGFVQMAGLPDTDMFYGLALVENSKGRALFVASDSRVYVTRDDGATWLDASFGLPLRPHGADLSFVDQKAGFGPLYLSTFGRSVWMSEV